MAIETLPSFLVAASSKSDRLGSDEIGHKAMSGKVGRGQAG